MKEYKLYAKHLKRSSLIGLLLLFSSFLIAQENTYFNRWYTYFPNANSLHYGGIINLDDKYLIISNALTPDYKGWGIASFEISPNGDLLDSSIILDTAKVISHVGGRNMQRISNNSIFYCGEARDTTTSSKSSTFLGKYNTQGDTLWTKNISLSAFSEFGRSIKYLGNNKVLMVGKSLQYGTDSFPLTLIDTNGVVLWRKFLEGESASSIEIGVESNVVYIGATIKVGNLDYDGRVYKVDTLGNVAWSKDIGVGGNRDGGYRVLSMPDSGVVVLGDSVYTDVSFSNEYEYSYAIRYDKNGKRLWTRDYYFLPYSEGNLIAQGLIDTDQMIVVAGLNQFVVNNYRRHYGVIAKIDPDNGELLWTRNIYTCDTIPTLNDYHFLIDILKTNDNGFIATGTSNNSACHGQRTWVVKTNCLGFDEPPFANFYVNNLSHTYLSATFKNASTHCDEVIWDFGDGSPILKVNTSDLNWTPSHVFPDEGSYTIKMTAFACGDTMEFERTVVLDKALSNGELKMENGKFKVYPNPSNDKVYIEGDFTNDFNASVELFNSIGQEVYSGKINSGNAVSEINISEFTTGIYLLKVTNGGQLLYYERVQVVR